jgi:transcriptional regulator with XRE-family HTH domain
MDEQALLSFGLWIKRRRKALDLTQDALAVLVGCSKDLIVKIEGDARRPSREIAALLATQLQLAPAERDDFIRCARAELAPDRLPSPARSAPRAAFVPAAPVLAHPPEQIASPLPSGTITFLFTDIAGSTRLWEQNPQAMPAAIERHNDILAAAIATHGGTVFKLVGDAVCAAFASAPEALAAALAAQRARERALGRNRTAAGAHGAAYRYGHRTQR